MSEIVPGGGSTVCNSGTGVFTWDSLEWVSGFVFNNSVSMLASFVSPSHFGQWFIATGGALDRMLSVLTHSGRAETDFVWLWRNKQKSSRAYHILAKGVWKKRELLRHKQQSGNSKRRLKIL